MGRPFQITAASETVRLDSNGQGDLVFTVSNVSGGSLRGRGKLVHQDPASQAWVTLSAEQEQDFAIGATRQFPAKVKVPAGSKAAKYTFRLVVVDVGNPDENYAEGPTAVFEVKPQPVKKSGFPIWIIPVAVVLLIGIGVGAWFLLKPSKETVPNVVGKSLDDAKQAIAQVNLNETDTEQTTTSTPSGQVISQQPDAGSSVDKNTTVALVVAAAPATVGVPNLRGHTVQDANTSLTQARLKLGTVTSRLADPDSVDKILDQQPKDGDQVASATAVNVVVGSVSVHVPNVVGQPYPQAVTTLNGQGLSPGTVTNDPNGNMSAGVVLRTSPDAGQAVATGSLVNIVVQQATVPVPDVTRQTINQAVLNLQGAQLQLGTVTGNMTGAAIISQAPAAGARVAVGTAVNVTVPGIPWIIRNPVFARPAVNPQNLQVIRPQ